MASSLAGSQETVVHQDDLGLDLLPVAAIYGANAAGKSNILAAIQFLSRAVEDSHRRWRPEGPIPQEPFLLDPQSQMAPSRFEIDFLLGGVRHRYGFELDADRVREEWLYAYPSRRQQLWFHRGSQGAAPFEFGKSLRGNNRRISALARRNSLFLSAAAENNHPALSPVYSWLVERLSFADGENREERIRLTAELVRNHKSAVLALLRLADLGITDLDLKSRFDSQLREAMRSLGPSFERLDESPLHETILEFRHSSTASPAGLSLPIEYESRGTRAWLSLAGSILQALDAGAVLCVDELDASLHPLLALEVIRIFQDPARNPKRAQLIFNTHDTTPLGNLLGGPILRRDQIWFVEKDDGGATHLYPLTELKPRRDENFERGYLQGRYGAVPFIASAPAADAGDA
ncbi:MAG TPA: ATP-binding protein [Thermoanaerobaculia bacterium]